MNKNKFLRFLVFIFLLSGSFWVSCREKKSLNLNASFPSFLEGVTPNPESFLTLENYQHGDHENDLPHGPGTAQGAMNRVCAIINPKPLLEPGDLYLSRNRIFKFLPERLTLSVDEQDERILESNEIVSVLGSYIVHDEAGKVIAQTAGPQIVCWTVELKVGRHIAVLIATTTSGTTSNYAWSFTLLKRP